jgi:hypothetical protein
MAITGRRHPRIDPALDGERALVIDALRLGRLLRDPSRWPAQWSQPTFGAEVERFRRHIAWLTTQEALAAAYDADVNRHLRPTADQAEGSPIRVAYALRWLELQEGSTGPSWPAMVR